VFSVTSDAAANVSFQGASSRPARPDPSQGNDSFGALVDSSTAIDTGNDRTASTAPEQPAPQRRSDDAPATSDGRASRNAAAPDQTAGNTADDRNGTAKQSSGDVPDATANAVAQPGAKPGASKAGPAKSNAKPSSVDTSAKHSSASLASTGLASTGLASTGVVSADLAISALQAAPAVTTPNAVAVAIAAPVTLTAVPAAAPASGNATAPLAIAAAAIAASASVISGTPAASPAPAAANAVPSTSATAVTATTSDAAASAKPDVQAVAGQPIAAPAKLQVTQPEITPATGIALAEAVAATAPVAPKATLLKAPVAAQAETKASAGTESAPSTSDPSATGAPTGAAHNNVAPQPALAGKPDTGNGIADAARIDASISPSSAATASAHEHSAATGAAQAMADSSDAGLQAAGTIQPQLNTPAVTAAPAAALIVTAATNGAVPLNGLALEIAVSAQSGKSRFEIRLDPADLGRIDVRIDVDSNGQVTSHLTVEKPETLSMLRQDAPQLQRALDDAGLKTGNGGLQFSLRDQSSSGQNNSNETSRNVQRLVISDETALPASVAGRTYGRVLGSSTGVDIRV
jgi:flagellar hook-length control protein FliK